MAAGLLGGELGALASLVSLGAGRMIAIGSTKGFDCLSVRFLALLRNGTRLTLSRLTLLVVNVGAPENLQTSTKNLEKSANLICLLETGV